MTRRWFWASSPPNLLSSRDKAQVIARIHEAARYVPLDRLYLSPGNAASPPVQIGNRLTEEDQWAKLALVKEIAEEVWG